MAVPGNRDAWLTPGPAQTPREMKNANTVRRTGHAVCLCSGRLQAGAQASTRSCGHARSRPVISSRRFTGECVVASMTPKRLGFGGLAIEQRWLRHRTLEHLIGVRPVDRNTAFDFVTEAERRAPPSQSEGRAPQVRKTGRLRHLPGCIVTDIWRSKIWGRTLSACGE